MSEEEKILKTIRYCANGYMKQEDGIQCFEWGELWVLNEYIKELQQENNQLKKDYAQIVSDNCDYLKLEQQLDKYKEVIEEVRKEVEESKLGWPYNEFVFKANVLQILDKAKENK